MIRDLLRALRDRLVTKLTPREPRSRDGRPTETWLWKMRRDFKKKRLIDPSTGRLDLRYNPLAIDDHVCMPVRERPGTYISGVEVGDPSEELAFLERLEGRGINLPKNDILRNDGKWRKLDINFNPLTNDEDYFIASRSVQTSPR